LCQTPENASGIDWEPNDPLSSVASIVVDREKHLKLFTVRFDAFERNIKRFGYTGRLTDTTLAEIQKDIHLKVDEIRDNNSITHFYWQSEHAFDHGNYNTE
jgi:hypothetical protein